MSLSFKTPAFHHFLVHSPVRSVAADSPAAQLSVHLKTTCFFTLAGMHTLDYETEHQIKLLTICQPATPIYHIFRSSYTGVQVEKKKNLRIL